MSLLQKLVDFISNSELKSYINDIPLDVISEKSRSLPVSVTSKRIEQGFNITDTTRKEQQIINITVVDNSDLYLQNREKLEKMLERGDLVTFYFANRDIYENMVLENLEEIESKDQKNGFTYYITLRQIQVVELTESDVKVDYKEAKSTGGTKTRGNAKISSPTLSEKAKVKEKVKEKTGFKELTGW